MGLSFFDLRPELRGMKVDQWWKHELKLHIHGVVIPPQGDEIDAQLDDDHADVKYAPKGYVYLSHDENEHGKEHDTYFVIVKSVHQELIVTHIFRYSDAVKHSSLEPFESGRSVESRRTKKLEKPYSINLQKLDSYRL